ncbi:MAG TPA: asparagine synthase-related protein [Acetobacteraceae bacterium]|nr:asparagine synthase-related protein [Acetobacteraceae bacterium]
MLAAGFTIAADRREFDIRLHGPRRLVRQLLCFDATAARTVLLIGQLLYRDDTRRRLGISAADGDAALAGACYDAAGVDGLCRLEGDFVVAVCDRRQGKISVVRDPMGHYPFFFARHGGGLALGTSIRPLGDLMPLEPDPDYAADYLAFPYDTCPEMPFGHTAYRGVERLRPGWLLECDVATASVTSRPWWCWNERVQELAVKSVADAGALVREKLEGAVRERRSRNARTASLFSGGFDSTGVALLATRLSHMEVDAVSLVFEKRERLARETDFIRAALERDPRLVWHPIPADDLLDYDGMDAMPPLDEPCALGPRRNTFAVLARTAAEAGADMLLSGDGADGLFGIVPRHYVGQLLRSGRWQEAWRWAKRYSYAYGLSAGRIMAEAMRDFLPARVRDGISVAHTGKRAEFDTLTERMVPPWLTDRFARYHHLRQRILAMQIPLARGGFITGEALSYSAGDWLTWYAALPNGAVMSQPFFDPRVTTLALGLPRALHAEPWPMKPVLAAALRDVLPEKIVARSRKVHFGIFIDGMMRHRQELAALIRDAPIDDDILDKAALLEALHKATLGLHQNQWTVGRLRVALSYLSWLSTRQAWRQLQVPSFHLDEVARVPSISL